MSEQSDPSEPVLQTTEELKKVISKWLLFNSQITSLNANIREIQQPIKAIRSEIKSLTTQQKAVTELLTHTLNANKIPGLKLTSGGYISVKKKKHTKPMTTESMILSLAKLLKDIDTSQLNEMVKFVKDDREVIVEDVIVFKPEKNET